MAEQHQDEKHAKDQPSDRDGGAEKPASSIKLALAAGVGALAVLALFGVVGLFIVYTGSFNVAATEQHSAFGRWALDTSFHNSVRRRADAVSAPASASPVMLDAGARSYKAMCEPCHGGPGAQRAPWASGMRPRPPHLAEAAAEWEMEEVFWIAKHGVKMSGMPAFGPTHDDAALWNIAAFVKELPAMEPDRYAGMGGGAGGHHGGHGH